MLKYLENNQTSVSLDLSDSADVLLFVFGGIKNGIGMPFFEFNNFLKQYKNLSKVFIRDINQAWYHKGLTGISEEIATTLDYIKQITKEKTYTKIIFIGNSAGGYAALLFGNLLNINKVIAFAPQTFINRKNRLLYQDFRWKKQIRAIYDYKNSTPAYYDLKKVLKNNSNTQNTIYFDSNDKLDKVNAQRLSSLENTNIIDLKLGKHNLIKAIRDNGLLKKIIENEIQGNKNI